MNVALHHAFPRPRDWWLLAGGLLLLLTFCLGSRGLNEPDEGRYASIAVTMARPGGDWWEPRMSGWGHYDKPPLIYWATAACFRGFGVNEWAARLPSLAGAMLTLAGLGWSAWRLRGPRVAWRAVLICGTSAQFWILGRLLVPDMLLCGWCTLAIAAWIECRARGGSWYFWWLSLAFWTLAWWTKATPTLIPLAGLALGSWIGGDNDGTRALRLPLLFPLILILGSPWYLSMLVHYPDLRSFFFGRELAGRMAGRVDGRHGTLLYYLPVSLAGWLPWWPVATWTAWRHRQGLPQDSGQNAAKTWAIRIGVEGWIVLTGLAIFSLVASKLPTYTICLMPWAALLMARAISSRESANSSRVTLLIPACGFALIAMAADCCLSPRYETNLGPNSSLRRVCLFLAQHGARRVDVDHYWPSLEIYLPNVSLFYVVRDDKANVIKDTARGASKRRHERYRERASDPGLPPNRFSEITPWPALPADGPRAEALSNGEMWFVRFTWQHDSPFNKFIRRKPGEIPPELMLRDGDFCVYRTVLTGGQLPAWQPARNLPP